MPVRVSTRGIPSSAQPRRHRGAPGRATKRLTLLQPEQRRRHLAVLGAALLATSFVVGEAWSLALVLCALSTLLVGDGVRLAWARIATALVAPVAFAAGYGDAYDGLIVASIGLWVLAFATSWHHRGREGA